MGISEVLGAWIKGKPNGHKIPYRLPELIAAPPSATIFIAEGEKDCDALARLSFVATCNSEGAGKWTADLNAYFRDRNEDSPELSVQERHLV